MLEHDPIRNKFIHLPFEQVIEKYYKIFAPLSATLFFVIRFRVKSLRMGVTLSSNLTKIAGNGVGAKWETINVGWNSIYAKWAPNKLYLRVLRTH